MATPTHILIPEYKYFKESIVLFEDIEDMSPLEIKFPERVPFSSVNNYSKSVAKQKWERQPLPKSFARFRGMSKEQIHAALTPDEHEFIMKQYYYLENGYWFFNNGCLTWITGTHWFYLQWWKIDVGFPIFKVADAKFFWHWDKECKDPESAGMLDMECRRGGKSYRAGCVLYVESFTRRDAMSGIQSKTDEDGEKMMQKTVIKPWKRLPFFFQPDFDNSNNPRNDLRFYSPTVRGTQSRDDLATEEALGSNIEVRSAVDIAFDGEKLLRSVDDEAGKIKKYSIITRWNVKKHCLHINNKIIGKGLVTSTVGEMDGGGDEFKELWEMSDDSKRVDGRTISWLSRHFRPAWEGFVVDEYGRTLKEESMAEIQRMLNSAKGKPAETSALKRQFPRTLKEAFRSSANECRFNVEIIDKRLEEFTFQNPNLSYGNFEWKDNKQDGEVVFVPRDKKNAKFCQSFLFDNPAMANKKHQKNGSWIPGNFNFGTAGADPFGYDDVSSSKKSMGTGTVFRGHDPIIDHQQKDISQWLTYRFICTYANRPGKREYGEDMIKMCVYYGIPMFPERNIAFINEYFTERGYAGFLLHPKDVNTHRVSKAGGATTNEPMIDKMFTELDNYIDNHGMREVHTEILEACRDADPKNLQPADRFVASGYAIVGERSKNMSYSKAAEQKSTSQPLFETYS